MDEHPGPEPKTNLRPVIRIFVVLIVMTNISASVPESAVHMTLLPRTILGLNDALLRPISTSLLEPLGIHNRWNMFTHHPNDTEHSWKNTKYFVEFRDGTGRSASYDIFPAEKLSFCERYVRYRQQRFKTCFWDLRQAYGQPLMESYLRVFARENPEFQFPVTAQVNLQMTYILAPGSNRVETEPILQAVNQMTFHSANDVCGGLDR